MLLLIKYISLLNIILICSFLGFYKSKKYENRVLELKKILNSLSMFKSKIEFTYEPICDIFNSISKIIYEEKENIFKLTTENIKKYDILNSWYIAIEECKNDLNIEDKEIIKMLGKLMGKTDKNGQINEINLTSKLLENQIEKAEEEKLKNTKLYKTLGIVFGLGISIVLF